MSRPAQHPHQSVDQGSPDCLWKTQLLGMRAGVGPSQVDRLKLQTVAYDAGQNVGYDAAQNVGYDATQNVVHHISALRQDLTSLHAAVAQATSEGGPATDGADSATASANRTISDALTQGNATIDQVDAMASSAYQIAGKLATGACSGMGPGNFGPVPHIN